MGAEYRQRVSFAIALTCGGLLPAALLYFLLGLMGSLVFTNPDSVARIHFWSGVPSLFLLAGLCAAGLAYGTRIEYWLRQHKAFKAALQLFVLFFTGFGGFMGILLIKQGI